MIPFLVQQSSIDISPDFVATEIGRGAIVTTSTRSSKIPVKQMLAPPSISDGLSHASEDVVARETETRTTKSVSNDRPHTRGNPTT